jgi:hypothetical protein
MTWALARNVKRILNFQCIDLKPQQATTDTFIVRFHSTPTVLPVNVGRVRILLKCDTDLQPRMGEKSEYMRCLYLVRPATEGAFFVSKFVSRLIHMTGDRSEEAKGYQPLPFIPSEV